MSYMDGRSRAVSLPRSWGRNCKLKGLERGNVRANPAWGEFQCTCDCVGAKSKYGKGWSHHLMTFPFEKKCFFKKKAHVGKEFFQFKHAHLTSDKKHLWPLRCSGAVAKMYPAKYKRMHTLPILFALTQRGRPGKTLGKFLSHSFFSVHLFGGAANILLQPNGSHEDALSLKLALLQRSPLFCAPSLVKFVPAVARLFCLALPGSFLTMFAQNKGDLCKWHELHPAQN